MDKQSSSSRSLSMIKQSIDWIIIHFLAIWLFIIQQFNTIRYFIFSALSLSPSTSVSSTTTTSLTLDHNIDSNNNNDDDNIDDQVC